MDRPPRVALIRLGKAAAVTVVLGLCMSFLPLGLAIFTPFLALPLAYVVVCGGHRWGLVLALVAALLVWFGAGILMAAVVFLVVFGMGSMLGEGLRRQWSFGRVLATVASTAFVALALWGAVLWQVMDLTLAGLRDSAFASIESAAKAYADLGMAADTTEAVSVHMKQFVETLPYLAPGLLAMGAILLAACSIGLAYLLFPRLRERVEVSVGLSGFRMHWSAAYVSIVGLAMLLLSRGDGAWQTVMLYAGVDLLLVSQTLFFFQGLAIVCWLLKAKQARSGSRVVLYVVALLGQMFFQLTGLLGLLDTWLDYRKRFALKSSHPGSPR